MTGKFNRSDADREDCGAALIPTTTSATRGLRKLRRGVCLCPARLRPSTDIDSVVENLPQFSAPGIDISELGAQVDAQARRERQIMDMIAAFWQRAARPSKAISAHTTSARLYQCSTDAIKTSSCTTAETSPAKRRARHAKNFVRCLQTRSRR